MQRISRINKRGFAQFIHPKLITGVLRFVVGYFLFIATQPKLIELGLPSEIATLLVAGVLVGLGIWSFVKLPL